MLKALAPTGFDPGQAFSTHAVTTVRTVIQTTPWYAVRSGCNQRNSTAQSQRGNLVSMSARFLNQTSWSSSLRTSRRNLAPRNPATLPQRSGKLCVILCTALLWLPLGGGPQNRMTGSKPNQPWLAPSLKPSELPSQSTNMHPVRGTYRFSGLPGSRLSRLLGSAQTDTGQNSARTSSLPP